MHPTDHGVTVSFSFPHRLREVVALWDALFALGAHAGVLFCVALAVDLRDELLLDPDPLARLLPRNLPALDARKLVAAAAALAPLVPKPLYDLVVRHPVDRLDRADVLAVAGDDGNVAAPPKPHVATRRASLIM